MVFELSERGFTIRRRLELPVRYRGKKLDAGYRIDLLINEEVIVELKSIQRIEPIHQAPLLTYPKLADKRFGLLLNFNVPVMKQGIGRLING